MKNSPIFFDQLSEEEKDEARINIRNGLNFAKKVRLDFCKKIDSVESLVAFARGLSVKPDEINDCLKSLGCDPISQGRKLHDLLMRNNVTFDLLSGVLPKLGDFLREQEMDAEVVEEAEIQIKYKGYIEREKFIADNASPGEYPYPGRFRFPFDECPDDRSPAETHPNPTCDDRAGFPYSRSFSGGCECVAGEIRSIKSFIGIEQYGLTAMFPNLTIVFGCICRLSMRIKIGR